MKRIPCSLLFFLFSLALTAQTDWQTWFERSGGKRTPRYPETVAFCQTLANASPLVHLTSFGGSPQGRMLPLLIVDKDGYGDRDSIRATGRLILLIQACIHPGEPEGKDAGLMLVRDLVTKDVGRGTKDVGRKDVGRKDIQDPEPSILYLLDHVSILFIPIFNVDGHERFGPYHRINQNGPEETGWRVTATNRNLNRDYLKADTPEMQAWLTLFNHWLPDFFIDTHTTDGADYQYVLTYMMETLGQMDSDLTAWCAGVFLPEWTARMDSAGFPVFPYVSFRRWHDPKSELLREVAPPMLSQGYVALRNRPGLLVETHMLKPYRQRVESVYHCLLASLEILNRRHAELKKLISRADVSMSSPEFLSSPFPLQYEISKSDSTLVDFRGVEYEEIRSDLTGGAWYRYSTVPATFQVPLFSTSRPSVTVTLPQAYIVPAEWSEVIHRLGLHGIRMNTLKNDSLIHVTSYKFKNPGWQQVPYEGRHPLVHIDYDEFTEERLFPAGSAYIETAQPAARVLAHLLEPKGDGSLVYWGFFDPVFEQKEYFEFYIMEPMARKMAEEDPEITREFMARKTADSTFSKSQWHMLNWFLERTPYADHRKLVYPVGRIEKGSRIEGRGSR